MDIFGLRRLEKMLRFYFMIEEVFRGCGLSLDGDLNDDVESKGANGHFSHILTREDGLMLHWWLFYTHSSSGKVGENSGLDRIECGARMGYLYQHPNHDPSLLTKHNHSAFVFCPGVTIGCMSHGKIYADLDTRALDPRHDEHIGAFRRWFFTLQCEGKGCEDGERSYCPPRKNAQRYAHQMLTTMGVFFEQTRG